MEQKLADTQKFFNNLRETYEANGEVTWDTFFSNQEIHKKKVVLLTNNDFNKGTLRIREPCMIKLIENIKFNPNRPQTWKSNNSITNDFNQATALDPNRVLDWMPHQNVENNSQYFEPEVSFAYTLGFFAALTIESSDIIIDLNGFVLEQHQEHILQQRFFACIELADQPFIPMQGPSNFGAILRSAKNLMICNGKIGASSHHGIHGNNASNVLFEDIVFDSFEVAAISINGSKNIYMNNLTINKNSRNVPVLGTYSAGRFIKNFVRYVQDHNLSSIGLDNAFEELNNDIDNVFNEIIFNNGHISGEYKNDDGLIDGNAYGILINPNGVAVNSFLEGRNSNKANETGNIYMNNCNINGIHGKINEIVAIGIDDVSNIAQVDIAGATLQFFRYVSMRVDDKYYYKGTSLSDTQIELAKVKKVLENNNQPTNFFGTLNIQEGIHLWKDDTTKYFTLTPDRKIILKDANGNNVKINNKDVIYQIFCNGDTMFHVNKGIIGLKVDGANKMHIENVIISDIINSGNRGSHIYGCYTKSHPQQGNMIGYHGAKTYGATFSAVNDLNCNKLTIDTIESKYAQATGMSLMNNSSNCNLENMNVSNIKAAVAEEFDGTRPLLPNELPKATGLFIGSDLFNIKVSNCDITNLQNMINYPYKKEYYDVHNNTILS